MPPLIQIAFPAENNVNFHTIRKGIIFCLDWALFPRVKSYIGHMNNARAQNCRDLLHVAAYDAQQTE